MGLTKDQQTALDAVKSGCNVFITGGGGVGKSYVIERIVELLEGQGKNVILTAPTGTAAYLIGGATCHRTFGIPIRGTWEAHAKVRDDSPVYAADTIVVDEISMLRIDAFSYVAEYIALVNEERLTGQSSCGKRKPIQLIVAGDFLQLPPVLVAPRDGSIGDYNLMCDHYGFDIKSGYAFLSPCWNSFDFAICNLQEVVRQSDADFVRALTQIRFGNKDGFAYIAKKQRKSKHKIGSGAISLAGKNRTAEAINGKALDKISGKERTYMASVTGDVKNDDKPTLDRLVLKVGAQVVMLVNGEDYHNGSTGVVTELYDDGVVVRLDNGIEVDILPYRWSVERYVSKEEKQKDGKTKTKVSLQEVGTFTQLPLKLGYAVTIHKSQGQTYSKMELEIGGRNGGHPEIFASGQLYVALSRCKSVADLHVNGNLDAVEVLADPVVLEFYHSIGITMPAVASDNAVEIPIKPKKITSNVPKAVAKKKKVTPVQTKQKQDANKQDKYLQEMDNLLAKMQKLL